MVQFVMYLKTYPQDSRQIKMMVCSPTSLFLALTTDHASDVDTQVVLVWYASFYHNVA